MIDSVIVSPESSQALFDSVGAVVLFQDLLPVVHATHVVDVLQEVLQLPVFS